MLRFHLIANAHLDPVWLWDWREGLNEGIATCRAVLGLMDEFPELTFVRGEAAIYEHIERNDPETFARIRALVAAGRWDVVGGTYVQPDTNLPATEVLVRHFQRGLSYFNRAFGVRPTVAWAPDSFGHSAGWPEIHAAAGMTAFAFSRPFAQDLALPNPAFWWEGPGGSRVLAWRMPIGWYGSTRGEIPERLDRHRQEAPAWGRQNVPIFFGLGNHGGGPSRAQVEAILAWRDRHPDVTVEFSTLHRFFAALRSEPASLPVHRGELNFALRGCYASAAAFKFAYRRTENALLQAERTASAVALATGAPTAELNAAWDAVLFNTFHDILPGTSIERAFGDQHAWIGGAYHAAQRVGFEALNRLADRIDTSVAAVTGDRPTTVPVLVWNSRPIPFDGPVEFEIPLDYRPLDAFRGRPEEAPLEVRDAQGRLLPFQCVATENDFAPEVPWRKRLIVRLRVPACGWHVITAGLAANQAKPVHVKTDLAGRSDRVSNQHWSLRAAPGAAWMSITETDPDVSGRSTRMRKSEAAPVSPKDSGRTLRLSLATMDDPWGSWGGHDGEPEANHVNHLRRAWVIDEVRRLEEGPERASLWVRWRAGASWCEQTFQLYRADEALIVQTRVFWTEKAARLKFMFSRGGDAEFQVPGGTIRRQPCGEVPGGRWVRVGGGDGGYVFASDALYNFDLTDETFGATVVRSCRPAASNRARPKEQPWRPYLDLGEHRFQFALGGAAADGAALAQRLESPPVAMVAVAHPGRLGRTGGVLQLPAGLELLALTRSATNDGWILRVQNVTTRPAQAVATLLGKPVALGRVRGGRIQTFLLRPKAGEWRVSAVTCAEEPLSNAAS